MKINCELVSATARDGFILDGIFCGSPNAHKCVVHVHGSLGNFYQGKLVRALAEYLPQHGVAFASFNTRCHDSITEGYWRDGKFSYVGGSVCEFTSCVDDISGMIEFVQSRGLEPVLQGHSLGCDRVLSYSISTHIEKIVLLSPCDSNHLQRLWMRGRSLFNLTRRLRKSDRSTKLIRLVKPTEYGVRGGGDWSYPIPMTARALLGIIEGPPFSLLDLRAPTTFHLNSEALVYMGRKDPLRTFTESEMKKHLSTGIRNVEFVIGSNSGHNCEGIELNVTKRVADFVKGASAHRTEIK